jgi:hypothetical protein
MSKTTKSISVTVSVANGIASFFYAPDGLIEVTESTDIVFDLVDSPALSFETPLMAYVPVGASRDIAYGISKKKTRLTLSDTDLDKEQIAVQLVVEDKYGNQYASPDPRILNGGKPT